jgi:hypothetical protein
LEKQNLRELFIPLKSFPLLLYPVFVAASNLVTDYPIQIISSFANSPGSNAG